MDVDSSLLVKAVVAMVMSLAVRGGLTAVGHRPDEVDDGRRKPSKVLYNIFGLSSMVCQLDRKPFFRPPQRRLTIHFTVFVDF